MESVFPLFTDVGHLFYEAAVHAKASGPRTSGTANSGCSTELLTVLVMSDEISSICGIRSAISMASRRRLL